MAPGEGGWRTARSLLVALLVLPGIASAQAPVDLSEDTIGCLRTELLEAGLASAEIDDLFAGRIENPETFVNRRIGEAGTLEIGRACFAEESAGFPPSPGSEGDQPNLTPEQRACVTQYLDEDLLDRFLRGEIRPEDVLSPERMHEIGRTCFADAVPTEHVPPTLDLDADVAACLRDAVGITAFNEISTGQRQPSPEEMAKGQACFPHSGPDAGTPSDLPEAVKQCVVGIIGQAKFDGIVTGNAQPDATLTAEEMRRVGETCFGSTPPGGHQGGTPSDVIACVENTLGKARAEELLRGVPPTPEEMERARGCFPQDAAIIEVSSPVEACVKQGLGPERYAALQHEGAQFSPEDMAKVQGCFPASGSASGGTVQPPDAGQCVAQCRTYQRAEGGTFSEDECQRLCAGEGISPTEQQPPTINIEQCVTSCQAQTGSTDDSCARACRGESVTFQSSPPPFPEPGTTSPPPATYDASQCTASCTGQPKYDATGAPSGTYSAEECSQLCGGTVQGSATERAAPWWLTFLLTLVGI